MAGDGNDHPEISGGKLPSAGSNCVSPSGQESSKRAIRKMMEERLVTISTAASV
jgi:hypothetical protein